MYANVLNHAENNHKTKYLTHFKRKDGNLCFKLNMQRFNHTELYFISLRPVF